jgi:hypothetical protein
VRLAAIHAAIEGMIRPMSWELKPLRIDVLRTPGPVGDRATTTRSQMVQPPGPGQGEAGSRYIHVEGTKSQRYASFGAFVFQLPKRGD